MFYFREKELEILNRFHRSSTASAMAIFGRRRTGKTQLITHYNKEYLEDGMIYYQITNGDYTQALSDFKQSIEEVIGKDSVLQSIRTFKDVFQYLSKTLEREYIFVIDEFPILAKKNQNVPIEFQWIIDHGMGGQKLILMGSQLSFMKKQIYSEEEPLYGRFDEIIHLLPFTFDEVHTLFPDDDEAIKVYGSTWGVAQYVKFFMNFNNVDEAMGELFFNKDGRLFREADNLLMMELKDLTVYKKILRAIGYSGKTTSQIAAKCQMEQRALTPYIAKLSDLEIINEVINSFPSKKETKRYEITDLLFRFTNAFIEPNLSLIQMAGTESMPHILDHQYTEYLGVIYEEVIRNKIVFLGLNGEIPFMPLHFGKWWGNICENGKWHETEVDIIEYNESSVIIGECKYKSKKIGKSILDDLKTKSLFIPTGNRKIYYLLASKSGFTDDILSLKDDNLLLIESYELL